MKVFELLSLQVTACGDSVAEANSPNCLSRLLIGPPGRRIRSPATREVEGCSCGECAEDSPPGARRGRSPSVPSVQLFNASRLVTRFEGSLIGSSVYAGIKANFCSKETDAVQSSLSCCRPSSAEIWVEWI